jgi:hypothetical protein
VLLQRQPLVFPPVEGHTTTMFAIITINNSKMLATRSASRSTVRCGATSTQPVSTRRAMMVAPLLLGALVAAGPALAAYGGAKELRALDSGARVFG